MHPDRPPLPLPQTFDRPLGEGMFFGRRVPVRTRLHLTHERYSEPAEINWFRLSEGQRAFIQIRPYILQGLKVYPPSADPELDSLFGRPGESPAYTSIRSGSAWYYPAVQGILLWELDLAPPSAPLTQSPTPICLPSGGPSRPPSWSCSPMPDFSSRLRGTPPTIKTPGIASSSRWGMHPT